MYEFHRIPLLTIDSPKGPEFIANRQTSSISESANPFGTRRPLKFTHCSNDRQCRSLNRNVQPNAVRAQAHHDESLSRIPNHRPPERLRQSPNNIRQAYLNPEAPARRSFVWRGAGWVREKDLRPPRFERACLFPFPSSTPSPTSLRLTAASSDHVGYRRVLLTATSNPQPHFLSRSI